LAHFRMRGNQGDAFVGRGAREIVDRHAAMVCSARANSCVSDGSCVSGWRRAGCHQLRLRS
jgi:hypothetical protein